MHQLLTAEKLNELAKVISEWAAVNFNNPPYNLPALGFLEEVGEIAHCLLKRIQKIRGFEDEAYFKEQLADAIADAEIYILNMCGILNIPFAGGSLHAENTEPFQDQDTAMHVLTSCAADLIQPGHNRSSVIGAVIEIQESLATLAHIHDIDFDQVVIETWEKNVSKRDWKKNPKDADKVATKSK